MNDPSVSLSDFQHAQYVERALDGPSTPKSPLVGLIASAKGAVIYDDPRLTIEQERERARRNRRHNGMTGLQRLVQAVSR